MNDVIFEQAHAKLNISLDVSAPRADGFHDMRMVMQSISLCDDIAITPTDDGSIFAESNLPYIPGDERNLAVRAARLYFEAAGLNSGLRIRMNKRIPVGAGMAGGSSDAAAVLRALNRTYAKLTPEMLYRLAEKTGSDVPFCLAGGTALAEGRGEILTRLPDLPACSIAVCKPEFSISTPELFHALDTVKLRTHPDTKGIISALESGDVRAVCRRMYNVFEAVPDRRMKVVGEIRRRMIDAGAEGAIMTGTGSAVFGIFLRKEEAEACCRALRESFAFVCVAEPTGEDYSIPAL